ncbi:hypothetical protein NE237_013323 [Protea cynaroides]|uniref:LRAT domain-containing protein n=1 Tax=Protea cynaroides TaxID=273540 RepID=A0A9Q0JZP5_9MAGN|nr:hypothetical protein NE237_013323 [Protea cynaroides]
MMELILSLSYMVLLIFGCSSSQNLPWPLDSSLSLSSSLLYPFCKGSTAAQARDRESDTEMGLLSNRVERSQIKAGDHIYSWRAIYTYSHHGIYVGGSKVVHFTREQDTGSNMETSHISSLESKLPSVCPTFPDCGFKQPNSGVVLSCLDCFLGNGHLYCFEYGVTPSAFLSKVRGGTCTMATSDPPEAVIHRAMYLLQNGFGNYDVTQNNCEDFALYCKTGLLIINRDSGVGSSGQASSVIGAPLAALLSSPLKLLMPGPVGVATAAAGMYCASRYATDIGVRTDVIKVAVEDVAVNLYWHEPDGQLSREESSSNNPTESTNDFVTPKTKRKRES